MARTEPARPVLAVVGPTCSGKTTLAVRLAELLAPGELVSADSRQVLRGLPVGTCAPTEEQLRGVPCHLIGIVDPGEAFTVADWAMRARTAIEAIGERSALPIVVGGTGLYVTALVEGYDFGDAAPAGDRADRVLRASTQEGLIALAAELRARNADAATRVDVRNPRRVIRALEILDAHQDRWPEGSGDAVTTLLVGLEPTREAHAAWIAERSRALFEDLGLLDEVRRVVAAGCSREVLAGSGIGYREALAVLEGTCPVADAVAATARRTLRYAKAQRTYWRRGSRVTWHDPAGLDVTALAHDLAARLDHHAAAGLQPP